MKLRRVVWARDTKFKVIITRTVVKLGSRGDLPGRSASEGTEFGPALSPAAPSTFRTPVVGRGRAGGRKPGRQVSEGRLWRAASSQNTP